MLLAPNEVSEPWPSGLTLKANLSSTCRRFWEIVASEEVPDTIVLKSSNTISTWYAWISPSWLNIGIICCSIPFPWKLGDRIRPKHIAESREPYAWRAPRPWIDRLDPVFDSGRSCYREVVSPFHPPEWASLRYPCIVDQSRRRGYRTVQCFCAHR